jgi:23S rRNA pseudouridine2605 synthase
MEERVQKILARAGFGSRRANEELIAAGRVRVNGKVIKLGDKADATVDTILVDGQPIPKEEPLTYIALHKPRGVLSDIDQVDPRETVRDLIPVPGHLFTVGRLDYDSEGLILMTNDGELANRLTHPRYGHEKEYRVLVTRRPEPEQLTIWRRGVVLPDGHKTIPAQVMVEGPAGKGAWLRVVLREGRKRQIREVGATIGLPVERIIRIRIGKLELGNLKLREWRHLTAAEVDALKRHATPRRFSPRVRKPASTASRPAGKAPERRKWGKKP